MKKFTVAGHSILDGVKKTRFATTMDRVKVLMRNGHTDIELQELPYAMTKDEIRAFFGEEAKTAKPKAVKAAAVVEAAAAVETEEDAAPDTVKWLEEGEQPAVEPEAITYATFEEALAAVPLRSDKGHFIKKEVREALARDMVAA
jgi:hypothetical protein